MMYLIMAILVGIGTGVVFLFMSRDGYLDDVEKIVFAALVSILGGLIWPVTLVFGILAGIMLFILKLIDGEIDLESFRREPKPTEDTFDPRKQK